VHRSAGSSIPQTTVMKFIESANLALLKIWHWEPWENLDLARELHSKKFVNHWYRLQNSLGWSLNPP